MALDPSISLDVRPPQFNLQIPQPLQQFGQILSLQNLMQQRQLFPIELQTRQLGLEQARLAYERDLALGKLFANSGADTTSIAPIRPADVNAPTSVSPLVVGQGQAGAPIHSPDAGVSWVNSVTGTPYSGPRYGETSIGTGPAGVPYDPSAATVQPILPPVATPAPLPAAAPAEATPSAPPPSVAAPPTAPALPSGGIPGLPTWQRMIQVGGPAAFPWIKNINEARTAELTQEKAQLEVAKGKSEDMVRLSNGMTDNESKNRLLPEAVAKGYITGDEARQFYGMDVSDPRFQARKESWGQQALTYDKSVELGIKRNEEARAQNKEVRDWVDFHNKQFEQEVSDFKGQVGTLTDASQFGPLLATKSPRLQAMYGQLVNQPLDNIKIWTGAGKPGETVPKPPSVAAQETAQAVAKAGSEATARIAAEDAPYVNRANDVKTGKVRWDQLPPQEQEHVGRILAAQGVTPAFTKPLTDTESKGLLTLRTGLDAVTDLKNELTGPKRFMTGPWADTIREIPVLGAKWEGLQGKMGMLQSTVGDLIKGGVLRASDQKVYEAMFPNMTDDPWTVREKLGNLETKLTNDIGRYKESLRAQNRFIPGDTPAAAPAGPGAASAPAGPSYQTIEKTGTPGAKVTGTFTIGGAAAAPPGKIVVQAPASRGGGKYYLDSDKWPQYQKQGFTRAE